MRIVAGIDGGGTKTTLIMKRLETNEKKEVKFGPLNINSIGTAAFKKLIFDIFVVVSGYGECVSICIGAAGVSNPLMKGIIDEVAREFNYQDILLLKGDQEIALYGAMAGKPGAILIAGTGSIGIGISKDGRSVRVGGWGHLIDDKGSGYALGREILSAYVKAEDGRCTPTLLTQMVNEKWNICSSSEVVSKIYPLENKSLIASLSPLVFEAARVGDEVSKAIIEKAAKDLYDIASALVMQLGDDTVIMCLMGGLLYEGSPLTEILHQKITSSLLNISLVTPAMNASEGALLWAENTYRK